MSEPQTPVAAQMVREPVRPPRRRRLWLVLLLLLLLMALGASLLLNVVLVASNIDVMEEEHKVREKYHSLERIATSKVAILSAEGAIYETDESFVKRQVDQILDDESVKAVVLRIDSPGGTIHGSDYLYHHIRKMREKRKIPVVVSMGGIAASGGYYLAMAAGDNGAIFAEPTTWTGSIGVIIPHYNAAEGLDKLGVKEDSVVSHRLKGMGSFSRDMTSEERAIFQELVDLSFDQFKDVIKANRKVFRENPEKLDELATGQIFAAEQAKAGGLVDEIGFVEEAIDRAIELAKLKRSQVRVVKYEPELSFSDLLLGAQAKPASLDASMLFELATPRGYYLWTAVAPLAANRGHFMAR